MVLPVAQPRSGAPRAPRDGADDRPRDDERGRRPPTADVPRWQEAMKSAVRTVGDLLDRVGLTEDAVDASSAAAEGFPVFVPPFYLAKIERARPDDPLLRQVLPRTAETRRHAGAAADPVGDLPAQVVPGVIRKYDSRALLITTGTCAVHCRYCFRREFPYAQRPRTMADWSEALATVGYDAAVDEIILSGGDPWTLADETLAELVGRIATFPSIRRVRVHTRLPLMIPERITTRLVEGLTATRLRPVVVLHANHPREVCGTVAAAIRPLRDAGVTLLNQSVLLAGVNDDADTLADLSESLHEAGVLPYYLHDLDAVPGAEHFRIPVAGGRTLIDQLRRRLPGYLVPRYVAEVAGEPAKVPLA